jgi:hypothetical protein
MHRMNERRAGGLQDISRWRKPPVPRQMDRLPRQGQEIWAALAPPPGRLVEVHRDPVAFATG